MFCRKLWPRFVCNKNEILKACTIKNQQDRVQVPDATEAGEGYEGDERRTRSQTHCPFLFLTQTAKEYIGLVGASLIVGVKLQRQLEYQSKRIPQPRRRPLPRAIDLNDALLLQRQGWISPFFLRASPVLGSIPQKPLQLVTASSSQETGSQSSLPNRIKEYKKDFGRLTRDYIHDIRNKVAIALITSKNGNEGVKYLQENLKDNSSCARTLYNLAIAYETGRHVSGSTEPDLKMAFEYYERAAGLNHKFATYNLALFYIYGKGPVETNLEEGTRLLEKAFGMGVKEAEVFRDFKEVIEASKKNLTLSSQSKDSLHTSSSAPNFLSSWISKSSSSEESSKKKKEEDFAQSFASLSSESSRDKQPVRWAVCF